MASVQYYMNYLIFFSDETEYSIALAATEGTGTAIITPRRAAEMFGIPYPYPSGNTADIPKGITFFFPFSPGQQYFFPSATGIFVDDTVVSQTIPGQAGVPASSWPAGPDGVFTWCANIVLNNGAGVSADPPVTAIARRRWIGGCGEWNNNLEGGSGATAGIRDSSRTIDGFGLCHRGTQNFDWSRNVNEYITGLSTSTSWERFYIRCRVVPAATDVGIWRCHSSAADSIGVGLKFRTNGNIDAFGINSAGVETNRGTILTPTLLTTWYRIDIFIKCATSPSTGFCRIFINGSFVLQAAFGEPAGTNHSRSELGKWTSGQDANVEIDFDDWSNMDLPGNVDTSTLLFNDTNYSLDWLLGSHTRRIYGVSGSQTNWTPASIITGVSNQGSNDPGRLSTASLTSTTSGAVAEALTDALLQNQQDTIASTLGAAAALIATDVSNAGSTSGQLGYKKAGGSATLTTITQGAALAIKGILYNPSAMITPDEISPWSLQKVKSADANSENFTVLANEVEYLGVWGPEDDPSFTFPTTRLGFLHNSRYGNTIFGYVGAQYEAPVYAVGGLYTGNGAYQEITLPTACHFLWIRPAAGGGNGGIKLFGASIGGHQGTGVQIIPNVRLFYDFANQLYKFSVNGTNADLNQNAVSYQYIAFCDPGMRYNLCGAFSHGATSPSPVANNLIVNTFTADGGFAQSESVGVVSSLGLYFKGPGNSGNNATKLDGSGQEANFGNFTAGVFNSLSGLHSPSGFFPVNYSLWRILDAGVNTNVMIQILQYTGNGAGGTRNISLTPVSGRFPLFVMVSPSAGANAYFRDPSHTTNTSSRVDTNATLTTAITAVAVDQITVGTTLNVNAVVYSVFAICGDTSGMNNGSYTPGFGIGSGPFSTPVDISGDINLIGTGGIEFGGDDVQLVVEDLSGIYQLIPGQRHDTILTRAGATDASTDIEIPEPFGETGYIGG